MSASHHAIVFVGKEGRLTTPFSLKKTTYILLFTSYCMKRNDYFGKNMAPFFC